MKLLLNLLLLQIFVTACSHSPVPKAPEVVVIKDPQTLPVETEVVLDREPFEKVVFTAKSTLPYMIDVARVANCVLSNPEFIKAVALYPKFTFTDKTPAQVAESLRDPKPVVLSTYRTKNPYSAAIATTFAGDPVVYFNTRRNPRPTPEMLETAFHEGLGHIQGYGHGDNYPAGKEDSVPYALGTIGARFITGCAQK